MRTFLLALPVLVHGAAPDDPGRAVPWHWQGRSASTVSSASRRQRGGSATARLRLLARVPRPSQCSCDAEAGSQDFAMVMSETWLRQPRDVPRPLLGLLPCLWTAPFSHQRGLRDGGRQAERIRAPVRRHVDAVSVQSEEGGSSQGGGAAAHGVAPALQARLWSRRGGEARCCGALLYVHIAIQPHREVRAWEPVHGVPRSTNATMRSPGAAELRTPLELYMQWQQHTSAGRPHGLGFHEGRAPCAAVIRGAASCGSSTRMRSSPPNS